MEIKFKIIGLSCEACTKLAKKKLEKIPDAKEAIVNLAGQASLQVSRKIDLIEVNDALEGTSFRAV